MSQPAAYLFVYGTLMSTADGALGDDMRARLHAGARSLGPATMPGRLYDLGPYPGIVDSHAAGEIVHGELLELMAEPDGVFLWLDPYEGIEAGAQAGEYVRTRRLVQLADGRELTAWVYLYLSDLTAGRHLPDGRWLNSRAK